MASIDDYDFFVCCRLTAKARRKRWNGLRGSSACRFISDKNADAETAVDIESTAFYREMEVNRTGNLLEGARLEGGNVAEAARLRRGYPPDHGERIRDREAEDYGSNGEAAGGGGGEDKGGTVDVGAAPSSFRNFSGIHFALRGRGPKIAGPMVYPLRLAKSKKILFSESGNDYINLNYFIGADFITTEGTDIAISEVYLKEVSLIFDEPS